MRNNTFDMLYKIYCDYAEGNGEHGSVLRQFSSVLREYKKNYAKWQPFYEPDIEERQILLEDKPKGMLITIAIILVGFFVLHAFFSGYIEWYVYAVIAGIVMSKKSEEGVWPFLLGITMLISFLVGYAMGSDVIPMTVYLFILDGYAAIGFLRYRKDSRRYNEIHEKNIQRVMELKEIEKNLEEEQKKLFMLLPDLKQEYSDVRRQFIEQNADSLSTEDKEAYKELPLVYWWEVKPQKLLEWEKTLANNRNEEFDISWEFKCIEKRKSIDYVEAGEEFSPLYVFDMESSEGKEIYDSNYREVQAKRGKITDFVALVLQSCEGTETVTYKDYKYNTLQRISKSMEWSAIGDNINRAHENGSLSNSAYESLSSYYRAQSLEAYSLINEQEERSYERGVQVKSSTFMWTGEVMLLPDPNVVNGYMLLDYRCQFQHMFENLVALKEDYDIIITKVLGDIKNRNVAFLAKVYQLFPECT